MIGRLSNDREVAVHRIIESCTKPLRGSFLAILSCSCISFDALSFLR